MQFSVSDSKDIIQLGRTRSLDLRSLWHQLISDPSSRDNYQLFVTENSSSMVEFVEVIQMINEQ